jgi:prepilin-type processing-associated H-X9-DG protein
MRFLLVLLFSSLVVPSAWALRIVECRSVGTTTPARYQKLELGVALETPPIRNPYDPAEITVWAEFVSPQDSVYRVPGFWYQDFKRCTTCAPFPRASATDTCLYCTTCPEDPKYLAPVATRLPWRVRFAPPTAGRWSYRVVVKHNNSTVFGPKTVVTVKPSTDPGHVGKHRNGRNFAFADGRLFFPVGMNVTGTWVLTNYNRLPYRDAQVGISRIADSGGNFARVLMTHAHFGIEGPDGPAGRYDVRQNRAYDLDALLEYAARRRVYIQLTLMTPDELFNSDEFGRAWPQHPYRKLMASDTGPEAFFTDSVSRQLLRQRIRYVMARWGYSPALFAAELMGEVDGFGGGTKDRQYWDGENPRNVRRWTDEMIGHARSFAPHHLYTISTAHTFSSFYPRPDTTVALYTSPQVDFVQDHFYSSDLNVEHQRAFLARRAAKLFPGKPYQLAEFGLVQNACWSGVSNFTAKRYPPGLLFHDLNELHNTLWSSSLNGSGGAALYWWANQVFGLCYGGQYHYLRPLQKFLADDPIFNNPYEPIASQCPGVTGPKDAVHTPAVPGNCIPLWAVNKEDGTDPDLLPSGATTSDEALEVFALRGAGRVVGWAHNRHNYWYKLPHSAGPSSTAECAALNDNQPTTPDSVPALVGKQVTILNVERPGRYRLEFFSTYPFYDLTRDGKDEQGGIIKEFTTEVRAVAGKLTFTVPPLRPLGTPPYAPDYGFKAIWLPETAPPTVVPKSIAPKVPVKAKAPVRKPTPSGRRK